MRLSVDAAVEFGRFKLSGDAAWLPYVAMYGWDTHWLRTGGNLGDFTSAVSRRRQGWGYQLEAFL